MAKPASERRSGVLRALGGSLGSILGNTGNLYSVYEIVRTVAKAAGYDLP
jgi:hypothetical protein